MINIYLLRNLKGALDEAALSRNLDPNGEIKMASLSHSGAIMA